MVAGVKKVVVKSFVEPIIEELHRPGMKHRSHQHSVCPPQGKLLRLRQQHDPYIEQQSIEQYLVIPARVNIKNTYLVHIKHKRRSYI